MLGAGFLAAQAGRRSRWALPLSFAAAMAVGFSLGALGIGVPAIEPLLAASVLVLGLAICAAARLPQSATAVGVALFGLVHGIAHGAEAPNASWSYAAGMLVSAVALMAAGVWMQHRFARTAKVAGALIAAVGAVLLLS